MGVVGLSGIAKRKMRLFIIKIYHKKRPFTKINIISFGSMMSSPVIFTITHFSFLKKEKTSK
jgi:superfamily I DNA and RNA helicase